METYRTYNTTILDQMVSHVFAWENTAKTESEMLYSNEKQS